MKIIIDEREAMLYELCISMNQTLNMPIEKRVLELGDILFMSDDESVTHLIIERKSFADLLSSIKDGRYAEQSHRLRNCFPNLHNVVYLLEGMFSTVKNDADLGCCGSSTSPADRRANRAGLPRIMSPSCVLGIGLRAMGTASAAEYTQI